MSKTDAREPEETVETAYPQGPASGEEAREMGVTDPLLQGDWSDLPIDKVQLSDDQEDLQDMHEDSQETPDGSSGGRLEED